MDISVYLPDSLAKRLDEYLDRESTTISKDALIAKCIKSFLEDAGDNRVERFAIPSECRRTPVRASSPRVVRDEQKDPANGWSEEILNWQGVKGAEDYRVRAPTLARV